MSRFIPDAVVIASLRVTAWAPSPASIAITEDSDFIVTLQATTNRVHQRRFSLTALAPPRSNEPSGSLVLVGDGDRLVLPIEGSPAEIIAFADALAFALAPAGLESRVPDDVL